MKRKRNQGSIRPSIYLLAGIIQILVIGTVATMFILLPASDLPTITGNGQINLETATIQDIAISPDGTRLAVAYYQPTSGSTLVVHEVDANYQLQPDITHVPVDKTQISDIEFMPDSKRILTAPEDRVNGNDGVFIYEIIDGRSWNFPGHYAAINADGQVMAITSGKIITFYDGNTGHLIDRVYEDGTFTHLALSPDGTILAAAYADHTIEQVQFLTTHLTPTDMPTHEPEDYLAGNGYRDLIFTPQGDRIVAAIGDNWLLLHNLVLDGATHGTTDEDSVGHIHRLAVQGNWLAVGKEDGVQLFHYETVPGWTTLLWNEQEMIRSPPVIALAFTPDEHYLLTAHMDGFLRMWDFRERTEVRSWSL